MEHITKIKTVFAILLLYIIIVPPLYAQSISVRSLPGYVKAINQFNQLNPQEKVYLHFDNTGYYLGDTIWFKAYAVFAEQLRPTTLSKVLHVELLTPHGKISIAVTPEKEQEFALRVRIPGWAQDAPVPTDLYSFTDKAQAYSISVNGSKVNAKQYDGYATLVRNWKAGDVVEINLPMEVRRVKANDQVEDDHGKLAIERGPIMFCLEGQDQADSTVFNKFIPDGTLMEASFHADLLNGIIVLNGTAKEVERNGNVKDVPFKAIPYSTWNNRGADQMAVWIPETAECARPTPEPTIASKARTLMIQAPIQKESLLLTLPGAFAGASGFFASADAGGMTASVFPSGFLGLSSGF